MNDTTSQITVLACGGRNYLDRDRVWLVLDRVHARYAVAMLVHGAARGADTLAADWAADRGVPAKAFLADWNTFGKSAGARRNKEMLNIGKPHLVVAWPGGPGTRHMVGLARVAGVPTLLVP